MKKWELFTHDADIGIRGIGENAAEAFEMGAMALTAVVTPPDKVPTKVKIKVELQENDIEMLFFDWINQIIFLMDAKKMLFGKFSIKIVENKLIAIIYGEEVSKFEGDFAVEIKAATLTELNVKREKDHWLAQCVVDI